MANAFEVLEKETGGSWNIARAEVLKEIETQSNKTAATNVIDKYKANPDKKQAQKSAYDSVLSDIKSTLIKGKDLKRGDFLDAVKKAEDIKAVIGEATAEETSLDPELIGMLANFVDKALKVLTDNTPGKISAGRKAIGAKMKSTAGGFLKGMVSQMTAGIPFAPELMEIAGAKIKGAVMGRGVSEEQKEMASMLGGVGTAGGAGGDAEANGGVSTGPTAGMKGLGNIKDMTGKAQSFFGKALGREEEIGKEEGGIVARGEGLEETNDILRDILIAVSPDREALEEAKRKKEMLRQEGAGGKVKFGQKGWMKGMMGGLMGGAMVIGAIAAAVGALIMMVFDGISGYFLAEEWGVSKTSAIIGAVIGGTGSGFSGAMWGGVKGGAAGFALGMGMGGPIGAVIGGIVGIIMGAIAGYFGGKKIATALDKMAKWFETKWNDFLSLFGLDDEQLSAETKVTKLQERKEELTGKIATMEKIMKKESFKKQSPAQQERSRQRLSNYKASLETVNVEIKERLQATEAGGGEDATKFTTEGRAARVAELQAGFDETNYSTKFGIKEAQKDYDTFLPLALAKIDQLENVQATAYALPQSIYEAKVQKWNNLIKNKKAGIGVLEDELKKLLNEQKLILEAEKNKKVKTQARGGIVTKPLYLPSSGIVVGEHPSYSGGGAYAGALTPLSQMGMGEVVPDRKNESGMEAIIPLDQRGIDVMKKAVGRDLNDAQMEKMMGRGARPEQPTTIIDASTIQNVSNNTVIRSPSPSGPGLHFERRDFVHKIA